MKMYVLEVVEPFELGETNQRSGGVTSGCCSLVVMQRNSVEFQLLEVSLAYPKAQRVTLPVREVSLK